MTEPITIIGSDTVVSGNLEGDEDLTIEGRVEGSITLSKTLTIETGGVVRANINVRNAIISGVLVGNIQAQESVHLTEQGRVVGDISAPRVILVDGSSFRGNIDMGDFETDQAPRTSGRASTPVKRLAPATVPTHTAAPSDDNEDATSQQTRLRRAIPASTAVAVRPAVVAARPAPAPAAPAPEAAVAQVKPTPVVSRAVPQKAMVPPTPKVRSVGKVKARKKN